MFTNNSDQQKVRKISGITLQQEEQIMSFLQGAVYCWCLNRGTEWFSLRDFMSGTNYFWNGTPLIELYKKHINLGKTEEDSVKAAGKDCGWLLKKVIQNDKRSFDSRNHGFIREYRWNGDRSNDAI